MRVERDINLLPSNEKKKINMNFSKRLMLIMITLGIIMLAVMLAINLLIHQVRQENEKLVSELAAAEDINRIISNRTTTTDELTKLKQVMEAIEADKFKVTKLLELLKSNLPENTGVSSIQISKDGSVNLDFNVNGPLETARLIVKLREMQIFEKVEINTVSIENTPSGISFSLNLNENGKKVIK